MAFRYIKPITLALVAGATCISSAGFAAEVSDLLGQPQSDKQETYNLDKVGVTAKRIKEKPTSPYATTESSQLQTEIISRQEIEAIHPQTVWEILEQVPGMDVTYQGRQHMEFSNMRGTGSYGIILDGVYLSQADRIIQALPVDAIESVTIVRDASAITLGPLNSIGTLNGGGYGASANNQGYVIIKTRRSTQTEAGFVGSYGSHNAEKYHLYGGSATGGFNYRLAGTYANDPGRDGWNMQTRNTTLVFNGGYTGESFDAQLTALWSHGKRNMEWGWTSTGFSVSAFNMVRCDPASIGLTLNKHWTPGQTTTFSYGYNGNNIVVDTSATSHAAPQNSYGSTYTLRHVVEYGNNILKAGVQRISYLSPGQAPNFNRTDQLVNSLFVEDEYKLFSNRLAVDAGIREDQKKFNNSAVSYKAEDQKSATSPSYTVGATYKPVSLITLTGRYAYNHSDPSSYMKSSDGSALPTSTTRRYELGAQVNIHSAFNPWATAYRYYTRNALTSTTGTDYSAANPATAKKVASYIDPTTGEEIDYMTTSAELVTHGIEVGSTGRIFSPLSYKASWTYVTTNNATTNYGMSRHLASAALRYQQGWFGANLDAHYAGPLWRSSSPMGVYYGLLANYWRLDANMNFSFKACGRDAKITLFGRNLGDRNYATRYVTGAYLDPGFTCGVQFACSFF